MSERHDGPTRGSARFTSGGPASFYEAGRHPVPCAAENVSRSGALLVGTFPVPASERLDLTLNTPNGSLSIELTGRIVRVASDPESAQTRIGVEFIELDDAKREAVEIFIARLAEPHPPGWLEGLKPGAAPHEVKKALESIPLPQRIALAQRAELRQREILRQDQHPAVLDSLIRNPSFTLAEARAIAASPFLQSGTIDLLAADMRFRGDEELRMALATHAKVSMVTAEKLTADFNARQIKKLFARPGLKQLLRDKLFKKLTRG